MSEPQSRDVVQLQNPETAVSNHECRAIRQLDRDDYSRGEIAFMFEMTSETVARHADRECRHQDLGQDKTSTKDFSREQIKTAFRLVYDSQPYKKMSRDAYNDHRPDDFPSAATIKRHMGSWTAARAAAWSDSDG